MMHFCCVVPILLKKLSYINCLPDIKHSIPKDLFLRGIQNAWTSMITAGFSLAFIVTQKVSYGKSVTASSTYKKGSLLR